MSKILRPDFPGRRPAPRVHAELSRRLAEMAGKMKLVGLTGCGITQEDVETLARELRDAVHCARALEGEKRPTVNKAVPVAFEVLHRAERQIAGARSALRERLEERDADPRGDIDADLTTGIAFLEQARAIIRGDRPTQS